MLPMYSTVKSTHLYSLACNFLIWQVSTPCRPPASLLGALSMNTRVKNAIDKDDNINVELDEDIFADSGQYATRTATTSPIVIVR